MTTWESGRESALLDDIIVGRKTIEGRLNRGKFAQYQVGDVVRLRRDVRNAQGELEDGLADAARVDVMAIRHYATFIELMRGEGYQHVIPSATSAEQAADEYDKYYTLADQQRYGVLAIEIAIKP